MNILTSRLNSTSVVLFLGLLAVGFAAQAQSPVPTFTKAFAPSTIGPGSVSTLRFDISNPSSLAVRNLAFTDNLPAGVTIADPAAASSTCGAGGSLSAPAGGGTITFSGGGVGSNASCNITVNVTSSTPGTHTNVSGDLTSDAGNSGPATADLTVATDRPGFSKSFSPASMFFGGRSTLTFTIDNTANSSGAANLNFTDNLPLGMVVADPSNAASNCATGTVSATPGGSVVSFSDFSSLEAVAAGASCTVSVDVLGNAIGLLGNTSGDMTSTPVFGGTARSSGKAAASLTVTVAQIALTKTFTDDPTPPGATVTLEFTVRNLDRRSAATDIEFTDDLDAVVSGLAATGLPLSNPCGSGSSLTGTGLISLTGGNLPAEGSCTFSVTLQVPSTASTGSFTNTSSAVSANVGGSPAGGNPASDVLFIEPAPTLTKSFTNDPVGAGESVTLEFTATNTSTTSAATDVAFIDELTTFLPFPVAVTLPPIPDPPCGAGSSLSLISLGTERQALSLTGGNLAAGASCTFEVSIDLPVGLAAGSYTNTTGEITATVDGETVTGNPASDTLAVVAAPSLLKEFTNDPVAPGDTVTLEFSLSHDEFAPGDATDIAFTDDLDAALSGLVATGLPLADVCGTGSELGGTTMTLMFTGGTLAPGDSCTFSVTLQVPATAPAGPHTNTTSAVEATVLGTTAMANPATDDLQIVGLVLTKEFTDDPVLPGGTVNLRFTIENLTSASTATDIFFQDDLDNVIDNLAATGLPLNDVCGTGSALTATGGGTFLTFQNGTLGPGESCTFDVTLQVPIGAAPDEYPNLTTALSATIDNSTVAFDPAQDSLVVAADFLALSKEFTDDPASPGGSVNLRFTLTNLDPAQAASNVAFTDDLDAALAGLVATGLPAAVCGGTVAGTGTISFSGGTLAGGETCSFDVALSVPSVVTLGTVAINLTSEATGTIGGLAVFGDPATDDLVINVLNFSKSFDADATPGGAVGLTFTIENLSSSEGISDLQFADDLDAVLAGLVASGLPAADVCGVGSLLSGTSIVTLTGGNLLPSGSCTFSVQLAVPAAAAPGEYFNTSSALRTTTQGEVAEGASATLTVIAVDDTDGDGVLDGDDFCPGTVIPEGVPTQRLGVNRYALVDDDFIFDTTPPPGGGNGPGDVFTTTDTAGCSCEQIIDELGLGQGHRKFGCSVGVMREWVRQVTPVFVSGFESG